MNTLIDTHCHLNMLVKKEFDRAMTQEELEAAHKYIDQATQMGVKTIINVGTSYIESINSVELAKKYQNIYASIGIHPNDLTDNWRDEINQLARLLADPQNKIIAIGETGIDYHYEGYNARRQADAFKHQIELALKHNLALIVHSRDASHETLAVLDAYKNEPLRTSIHCFSYGTDIAKECISRGYYLGIDAPITYPKNNELRDIVKSIGLDHLVLETDAPFLPPQALRGKQNTPEHIFTIAQYIAQLLNISITDVSQKTTHNARTLFSLPS